MTKGDKLLNDNGYKLLRKIIGGIIYVKEKTKFLIFIKDDAHKIGYVCVETNNIDEPETYKPLIITLKSHDAINCKIKEMINDE